MDSGSPVLRDVGISVGIEFRVVGDDGDGDGDGDGMCYVKETGDVLKCQQ